MACNNCGKAIKTAYNNNIIDENAKSEMMQIHDDGNKGKHAEWESGHTMMLDASKDAYSQGIISKEAYELCEKINDDGNDAKHLWD